MLGEDHQALPDEAIWDEATGETFGSARARFETFGPEVSASKVPALLEAGLMVWSFGYGDDPEDFTTLDVDDIENADWDSGAPEWGPFRLDADDLRLPRNEVVAAHINDGAHDESAVPGCPICDSLMADGWRDSVADASLYGEADYSGPWVTFQVELPNGVVTPMSVDCESETRSTALLAMVAAIAEAMEAGISSIDGMAEAFGDPDGSLGEKASAWQHILDRLPAKPTKSAVHI